VTLGAVYELLFNAQQSQLAILRPDEFCASAVLHFINFEIIG
jgi:hypothetical protein